MSSRLWLLKSAALLALAVALAPSAARLHADDDESVAVPPKVERAVNDGLEYLAKIQGTDGRWSASGHPAAATGLCVMAFMARGHVPGQGPYGENLNRGVEALVKIQQSTGANGYFGGSMYDHGICTVALCEVYGMLDDARQAGVRNAIQKAVRVILDAQNIPKQPTFQGGWRYSPSSTDSDTSVSGWQLMALRGASNAGANIPEKAIQDGIDFIKRRAVFGGGFSYEGSQGANPALTGTGVLALSLMGQPNSPEVKAGGDYLLRNVGQIGEGGHYYYSVYYCSQAAWQLGGNYWTIINRAISDNLLAKQAANGSWSGGESDESYCTSMAILALTVPYRYLPIYQR